MLQVFARKLNDTFVCLFVSIAFYQKSYMWVNGWAIGFYYFVFFCLFAIIYLHFYRITVRNSEFVWFKTKPINSQIIIWMIFSMFLLSASEHNDFTFGDPFSPQYIFGILLAACVSVRKIFQKKMIVNIIINVSV